MSNIELYDNVQLPDLLSGIRDRVKRTRSTKTPIKNIKKREGKGKKIFSYIDWVTAAKWLDDNYPGWSFEVEPNSFKEYAGFISCVGRLTVIEREGLKRVLQCVGTNEVKFSREDNKPLMLEYYKSAETDSLKRCVARLGGFNDVYTDIETEDNQLADEELVNWVYHIVLPQLHQRLTSAYTPRHIFNMIKGVLLGNITKQEIITKLKIKEMI